MEISCPNCGHKNSKLRQYCEKCGLNLYHLVQMQDRIATLEVESAQLLGEQNWLAAYGVICILLEYKPNSTKYLIGLGTAAAELNDISTAEEIVLQLSKRLKRNKDVQKLGELIEQKKTKPNKV